VAIGLTYTLEMTKRVEPSISSVSFNCPHCEALAHQHWYNTCASPIEKNGTPFRADLDFIEVIKKDKNFPEDHRESQIEFVQRCVRGEVFLESTQKSRYGDPDVINLSISRCYSCKALSVWIHEKVVHPPLRVGVEPNADLPPDILRDYDEARSILDASPRGAAALLRLAIQKLCAHLGEPGKNISDDIASLVKKGLDKRVQQALDIVRVIGNDAVHPGQIDLSDDRNTATKLFGLVNLIAEKMISEPQHVEALRFSCEEPDGVVSARGLAAVDRAHRRARCVRDPHRVRGLAARVRIRRVKPPDRFARHDPMSFA
jgi:hypothetical protein